MAFHSNGTGWLLDQIPVEDMDREMLLLWCIWIFGGLQEAADCLKHGELALACRARLILFERGQAPEGDV